MEPLIEKMGLPVVKIHDTDFYLYSRGLLFQQVDNRDNQIFFTQLRERGAHTLLLFDTQTHAAYTGLQEEFVRPKHVVEVQLPGLKTLMGAELFQIVEEFRDDRLKKKLGISDESIQRLKQLKKKNRKL